MSLQLLGQANCTLSKMSEHHWWKVQYQQKHLCSVTVSHFKVFYMVARGANSTTIQEQPKSYLWEMTHAWRG